METAKTRQDEAASPRQPHRTTQVPDVRETGHGATREKIWGREVSRFAQCAEIGIMCFFLVFSPRVSCRVLFLGIRDPLPTPVHRNREWRAGNHGKILGNPGPPQPCNPAGHLPPRSPVNHGLFFSFCSQKAWRSRASREGGPSILLGTLLLLKLLQGQVGLFLFLFPSFSPLSKNGSVRFVRLIEFGGWRHVAPCFPSTCSPKSGRLRV